MGMSIRVRQAAAWIACFAILLAALAPGISHAFALAHDQASLRKTICSMGGHGAVQAMDHSAHHSSAPTGKTGKADHSEHCPFCLTHAGSFGLPPTTGFPLPVAAGALSYPELFYQSPRPLFVWATPYSRAPPVLS